MANKKKLEIVAPKHLNSGALAISFFPSNSFTMIFLARPVVPVFFLLERDCIIYIITGRM